MTSPEMEFLDINLTKDCRVFCSLLFTLPSTGGFFFLSRKTPQKNQIAGFKNPYKNSVKQS
jgi:hypothetical protein